MNAEDQKKLETLQNNVIEELRKISDQLAIEDGGDYSLALTLARNSSSVEPLQRLLEKAKKIEDPAERADILMEILDEISARQQLGETEKQTHTESKEVASASASTAPSATDSDDKGVRVNVRTGNSA